MRLQQATRAMVAGILVTAPGLAFAQSTGRQPERSRIFVDARLLGSLRAATEEREFQSRFVVSGEVGSFRAIYRRPSARMTPLLDIGLGVMVQRRVAVGVAYHRATFEGPADLIATIPHPDFLFALATARTVSEPLQRREHALHLSGIWMPVRTRRLEFRLSGGPTYFHQTAEMVRDLSYVQTATPLDPQNSIAITGLTTGAEDAGGWGFHAGGDLTYFVTGQVGLTGGLRLSRGILSLEPEPLSGLAQRIVVGSPVAFLGVRVRVGG